MAISVVAVLWEKAHFHGIKRTLVSSIPDLRSTSFNDFTECIALHPGPDIAPGQTVSYETVSFFEHIGYVGRELCLATGMYPDLSVLSFDNVASSVRFNGNDVRQPGIYSETGALLQSLPRDTPAPSRFYQIPLVVELRSDVTEVNPFTGAPEPLPDSQRWITLVESCMSIKSDFGGNYDNDATSVMITAGSNYNGETVRLYRDDNKGGGSIELGINAQTIVPGFYPDLRVQPYDFSDETSSVEFILH